MKINAHSQAQMIKLLLEGAYTCKELAEQTGLHYVTVLQYTRELHRAKAAHICMWEKDTLGRDLVKVYKLGEGKDAKRLTMTPAERQKRHREKRQAININRVITGNARYEQAANGRIVCKETA